MSKLNRRSLMTLGAGLALPALALADEQCGERPNTAPALQPPLLLTDWAWLARYRDDNAKLKASGVPTRYVHFTDKGHMGITDEVIKEARAFIAEVEQKK